MRQSQTWWTKRLKNNVFSQNSQKMGFWLLSGLSEFYVYCSLCIFAMIFTIYVSCRWMSRLTFEKKNGIKKWYFQAIWCPDLKSHEKIVTIFCSFFSVFIVFLMHFEVCKEQYHSKTKYTPCHSYCEWTGTIRFITHSIFISKNIWGIPWHKSVFIGRDCVILKRALYQTFC